MVLNAAKITALPDGGVLLTSAPERIAAWSAIFLVVMPVSLWLWRRGIGGRYPPGAFIVSFFIPLFVVPGIAMESVRVTRSELAVRTGFWFAPTMKEFPLEGLSEIEDTVDRRSKRVWFFRYASGRSSRLHLPNLLEANRPPVVGALVARGIPVTVGD
jgi:hypothetical protein